jgi:hypothetical protein
MWSIAYWLFRLFGFSEEAEICVKEIEAKKKRKDIANAPETKNEEIDGFNKW